MHPTAHILTIGDELLKGSVLNTNAQFLGRELTSGGFSVAAQISCPDDLQNITAKLRESLDTCDLLIATGGLGPTPDDVTRDAAALYFKSRLIVSPKQLKFIQNHYARRGKVMPAMVRKEAEFPKNAVPLFNRYGIALGFSIEKAGKLAIFLPGVPSELEKMYVELVKPLIQKHFENPAPKFPLIVKNTGISEPDVMLKLKKDFFEDAFDFGIYPEIGEVSLRLYAPTAAVQKKLRAKILSRLKGYTYALEETSLSAVIGQILTSRKQTLAAAESCTGGLLSAEITRIPGASRYFKGSLVAYSNEIKQNGLDVPEKILKTQGAVSRSTAGLMASGARKKMKTTYALGITGIAGPGGGSPSKPVGWVYISLSGPAGTKIWEEHCWGDRKQIQMRAVKKALEYLWRTLKK